jgi:YD repeat-containing protein
VDDTSTSPATHYVSRCYGRSDNLNITNIWDNLDSTKNQSFWYTASNRLQNASGIWGASTYYYDAVGNRTYDIESATGTTNVYGYPANSNLLGNVTQGSTVVRAFAYDGAGNITSDSAKGSYVYNARGRLTELDINSAAIADYAYDGLERLAIRTTQNMTPSGTTQYIYDTAGHLLAESDGSGHTLTEYVWLDDMPLAVVANVNTGPNLYFVHVDHLDRPIMMTDVNKTLV